MGKSEEHLLEAAKSQDLPLVQKLLHKGRGKLLGSSRKVNVNFQDADGFSALHHAATSGNVDLAYLLIDGGAAVDQRDGKGLRPLHYCSWKGKVEMMAALLESGSACDAPSAGGCTPLHLSAQYGHHAACKLLLQYGASIAARQQDGSTPLDFACEFGRSEVVELLLHSNDAPALLERFHAQDGDYTAASGPLHLAARNGHLPVIRSLLQAGVDINWRTAAGTCLHEAVASERTEIVQLLIDCGIDTSRRSGLGQTALELARKVPKTPAIMEIIRKLADAQPRFMQVRAVNDFQNILDPRSLPFTRGTIITVLEQNADGNWRGRVDRPDGPVVGVFPSSYVQPFQQVAPNHNMAGSDDSGIHPHDDDAPNWTPPPQWGRPPSLKHLPHKYVNMDPRSVPNHHQPSKVALVNNPSYEDVICSNGADRPITTPQVSQEHPITVSRSPQHSFATKPHIANPGYEDVLLDQSNSSSPTNTFASGSSHRSSFEVPSRRSYTTADDMTSRQTDPEVHTWLASFGMQQYAPNFVGHGYDLRTIARASPADLAAIQISNPPHRKKLATHIGLLRKSSPPSPQMVAPPASVDAWLGGMGLGEYAPLFARGGVTTTGQLARTTWEELQEMGVHKLGHQKKIMLGIAKLSQVVKISGGAPPPPHARPQHAPTANAQFRPPNPIPIVPPTGSQQPNAPNFARPRQPRSEPHFTQAGPRKPAAQDKPFSSKALLRESPGLSMELQKALTRRQKIIDDDEKQPPHPVAPKPALPPGSPSYDVDPNAPSRPATGYASDPTSNHPPKSSPSHPPTKSPLSDPPPPSYPPSASQVDRSPPHQGVRRAGSHRGPPPNPPKRTSSVCLDDPPPISVPTDDVGNSCVAMATQLRRSEEAITSSNATTNQSSRFPLQPHSQEVSTPAPLSHPTSNLQLRHNNQNVATLQPTSQAAAQTPNPRNSGPPPPPKPTVASRPKPGVVAKPLFSKKPQLTKGTTHNAAQKAGRVEAGNHFDLSVLDPPPVANKPAPPLVAAKPTPNRPQKPQPASSLQKPPPPAVAAKPVSSKPQVSVSMDEADSAPSLPRVKSLDNFDWPAPPPDMLPPAPPPVVTPPQIPPARTCFEEDEDTGTVKRRPPSIAQHDDPPLSSAALWSHKAEPSLLTHPGNHGNTRPASPSPHLKPAPLPPSSTGPPPIPRKAGKSVPEEPLDATDADKADAQRMLADIGSMFDDLVQEFDDILS